jgi:hypothetical protein
MLQWCGEAVTGSLKSLVCLRVRGSVTFAFARLNDVGGRIRVDNIRAEPLANDVDGEQAFDGGKASQVAQKVTAFPGSAISSVTSTHGVTR